jgi:photosystem II stability/assembly factor-like uncharacterized protein
MRVWHHILFLALLSGCQSVTLIDDIVRQDSTLRFEKLDGPRGDIVLSITSSADGILYAGTRGNGVIRSGDGGDSWEATALAQGTVRPVYVAPGGSVIAFHREEGERRNILRSTDNGQNWLVLTDSIAKYYGDVVVRSWGNAMYSQGGGGFHRSMDDGVTWETLHPGPFSDTRQGDVELLILSDSVLYAGTSSGVYHSQDGGRNWKRILNEWESFEQLEKEPSGGVLVFAKRGRLQGQWTPVSRLRLAPDGSVTEYPLRRGHDYDKTILLRSGTMLGASRIHSHGIWRSEDGGRSCEATSCRRDAIFDFTESPDGLAYAAMHGAILRSSDDGRTWKDCSSKLAPQAVNHFFKDAGGTVYAGTERGGLYAASDPTAAWGKPLYGQCSILGGFSSQNGHLLLGATRVMEAEMYRYDGVEIFDMVAPGLTLLATSDAGSSWNVFDPSRRDLPHFIAQGSDRSVYSNRDSANVSADGGWTWTTEPMLIDARCIHSSTAGLFVIRRDTLLFRTDGSDEWHALLVSPKLRSITACGDTVLCISDTEFKRSTDRGDHWDSWRYTAPRLPRKQLIRLSSVSAVIVGENNCVLLSTDAGASWRELRVQLADYGRVNTALLDMDGYLLLGTTEGLLRSTTPVLESLAR